MLAIRQNTGAISFDKITKNFGEEEDLTENMNSMYYSLLIQMKQNEHQVMLHREIQYSELKKLNVELVNLR